MAVAPPALRRADSGIALAVGLVALALYLRTLAPGVVTLFDDSLEFQLLAWRGAIAHPTGYPLYTILLWLLAHALPVGEVAFRANLLSALSASGALALTFLTGRALGLGRVAALVASALFALSPTFWAQATIAEVYALHLLLGAALLLLLLRAVAAPEQAGRWLLGAAFVVGLGLAHHRMMVLWLPAAALLVAWRAPRWLRPARHWLHAAAALAAPLLLYLWLPLRAPVGSLDGSYATVGFRCWVTACQYQESFLASAPVRGPTFFAALTWAELGGLGVVLALVGLVALPRAGRARAAFLLAGLGPNALFAMFYRAEDIAVFWLPALWAIALLAGWGVEALARPPRLPTSPSWRGLLGGVLALLLLWQGAARFPSADRSAVAGPPAEQLNGPDVLAQPLPARALVVALLGEATWLRYLQETRGLAPTVAVVAATSEAERWAAVEAALAADQRPFLTTELPGAGERWSLSALGPLVEVRAEPLRVLPAALWPLALPVSEAVVLEGWTRSPVTGRAEERITLAWRVVAPLHEPLQLSLRLIGADGALLAQQDRPPVRRAYPTTLWRPGELILDSYELPPAPPGARYLLILYRPGDGSEVGRADWAASSGAR